MKYEKILINTLLGASVLLSSAVMAENHVVTVDITAFKPMVLKIEPGDTVSWENMTGHIVDTTFTDPDGTHQYLPEGAEGWISEFGMDFQTPPLTIPGVYLYKCDPHWGLGMGGAIIVGTPTNLADIQATKPKGVLKRLVKKTEKALK